MENFNKNNPTQGWTEDEKYDFCKMENKWIKELPKNTSGNRKVGVAGAANDPAFSSAEEINASFKRDILRRKENWKHLCHICEYATNIKKDLPQHLAVHGIGERFKCDKCNKDFALTSSLQRHRELHNSSFRQKCKLCDKTFKAQKILKAHIQEMHAEKHLKCDECEKMFSNIRKLNHHKRGVHVLKSFKCDQCKYRTKTMNNLKIHKKGVHDGVRDISAKCDLCNFQGTNSAVKIHKEAIHENKKNWFCKACPYSTYMKHNFLRHMRIHTGEKPYECKTCHERFSKVGKAKSHCKK